MDVSKIAKLDDLLADFLGDQIIADHETTNLTAMGENYGSLMLAVKIYTDNKSKVFEAVAKLPPPNEFLQKAFNTPITFRNELHFYKTVIPELESFLRDKNLDGFLDCFPKFMGGRLSFQADKNYADMDAVIVLENLKPSGYVTANRRVGYGLEAAKLILRALAKFHATPLALKLQRPATFQNLIKPIATTYKVFEFDDAMFAAVIERNRAVIDGIDSCKQYTDKLVAAFKAYPPVPKNTPEFTREPFATIIHTDAWVANFMVRFQDDQPHSCKIVDFQLAEYGSPARDILFFLFTSVQIPVLQKHYDELVDFYYKHLIDDLARMGCDVAPFTRNKFDEEIVLAAKEFQFMQCMIMLKPIYATMDSLKNLDEYVEDDLIDDREVSQEHKDRAAFIVTEFVKKKWI